MDFRLAHEEVTKLVETFAASFAKYHEGGYNETAVRNDFLNKFFIALGWDVNHETQTNPYAQEVKVERSVSVAARVKKADYAFFIEPNFNTERFFVEAKRPSVALETPDNCFQTIRYAYSSSRAALSLLTNFKEFVVMDCRFQPDINNATNHVHRKFYFEDFKDADKFGEIFYLFGREAVAAGKLDEYAAKLPKPKGKVRQRKLFTDGFQEIDESFLEKLEEYRADLARMFKRKNPALNSEDLTEATQRTLDRLVFIRFLEDKLIEPSTILDKFGGKPHAWKQFIAKSKEFDKTYNGIIFKSHPVIDADSFEVDDRVFLDICDDFASAYSPYHFNYVPIHILGSIYERFLGNVIVVKGKSATVEPKPEVRKAGGVFYTPEYIVRYIVENTIGRLVEKKTPKDVAKMRFADIACGSGSFLLGVYDYLLRWHTSYYNQPKNKTEAKRAGCVAHEDGTFHLSFEQKREILTNNIYGTDIDRQAFEVTQLSLFLKLLEEETQGTKQQYLTGVRESMLPSLTENKETGQANIVCGNALVDWDVSGGNLPGMDDEDKLMKLNPMSFRMKFPEVMKQGGFDAIVGNPPYVRMEGFKDLKDYLRKKFDSHDERSDLYAYFVEQANKLLNKNGMYGVIVSNKFLRANYGKPLRDYLVKKTNVEQVIDFAGLPVFKGATVRTVILITSPNKEKIISETIYAPPTDSDTFNRLRNRSITVAEIVKATSFNVHSKALKKDGWSFSQNENDNLLDSLKSKHLSLKKYCDGKICRGVVSGLTEAFIIDAEKRKEILKKNPEAEEIIKPFLNGRDVRRYQIEGKNQFLIYTYHGVNIAKYPAVKKHLEPFKEKLNKRATKQQWYELQQPQLKFAPYMDGKKIIFPDISTITRFAFDTNGYYGSNTTYFIPLDDLFLLALLNSKLGFFYFSQTCAGLESKGETYLRFFGQYLEGFPVYAVDLKNPKEKAMHDALGRSVEQLMQAKLKLAEAKNDGEREHLQNKCDVLEKNIDETVYRLYDLSETEINLIENP